jgi:hypothetical protein
MASPLCRKKREGTVYHQQLLPSKIALHLVFPEGAKIIKESKARILFFFFSISRLLILFKQELSREFQVVAV